MTHRTHLAVSALVAVTATGLVACSGSSSPAAGPTPGASTSSQGPGLTPSAAPTVAATGSLGTPRTVVVATGTKLSVAGAAPKGAKRTPPGPNQQVAPPHEHYATAVVRLRNTSGSPQPVANVFDTTSGDSTFALAIPMRDRQAFGGYTCSDDLLPAHWCGLSTIVAAATPTLRSDSSIPAGGVVRLLLASTSPLQVTAPMQHVAVFVLQPGNRIGVQLTHP